MQPGTAQYLDDSNLKSRQQLWHLSRRDPSILPSTLGRRIGSPGPNRFGARGGLWQWRLPCSVRGCWRGHFGWDACCQRLQTSNPLVRADAAELPFRTDSFDAVLAPFMLYHVSERAAAVREFRRVLRPSGVCIAVTSGEDNQRELVSLVEEEAGHGWQWRRPSAVAFSLENGMEQMRTAFSQVELIRCPPSVVSVTDADLLADYLRSVPTPTNTKSKAHGRNWSFVSAPRWPRPFAPTDRSLSLLRSGRFCAIEPEVLRAGPLEEAVAERRGGGALRHFGTSGAGVLGIRSSKSAAPEDEHVVAK